MKEWRKQFPEIERQKIVGAAKNSLLNKKEGRKALDYLIDKRGLNKEVIDRYNIGYCPSFIEHQLRGRIITPIYNVYGKLIALSTRHLNENAPNRFWHETFDKSYNIYGLYQAKERIIKNKKVLLVEGEIDNLCYQSHGIDITISACGSSFSLFQIALLSRYCSEIFVMFDGDDAGEKALDRIVNKIYNKYFLESYGIHIIPIRLPQNYDPDEYLLENGAKEVIKLLKKAKQDYNEFR
ncbi:MAG: toprim domain-containing protein [bacterium]